MIFRCTHRRVAVDSLGRRADCVVNRCVEPREVGVVGWIKKILVLLVAAFVVFYLFTRPEAAAEAVKTFFGAFEALGTFFTSLAS